MYAPYKTPGQNPNWLLEFGVAPIFLILFPFDFYFFPVRDVNTNHFTTEAFLIVF
jgi:hypothetical protein